MVDKPRAPGRGGRPVEDLRKEPEFNDLTEVERDPKKGGVLAGTNAASTSGRSGKDVLVKGQGKAGPGKKSRKEKDALTPTSGGVNTGGSKKKRREVKSATPVVVAQAQDGAHPIGEWKEAARATGVELLKMQKDAGITYNADGSARLSGPLGTEAGPIVAGALDATPKGSLVGAALKGFNIFMKSAPAQARAIVEQAQKNEANAALAKPNFIRDAGTSGLAAQKAIEHKLKDVKEVAGSAQRATFMAQLFSVAAGTLRAIGLKAIEGDMGVDANLFKANDFSALETHRKIENEKTRFVEITARIKELSHEWLLLAAIPQPTGTAVEKAQLLLEWNRKCDELSRQTARALQELNALATALGLPPLVADAVLVKVKNQVNEAVKARKAAKEAGGSDLDMVKAAAKADAKSQAKEADAATPAPSEREAAPARAAAPVIGAEHPLSARARKISVEWFSEILHRVATELWIFGPPSVLDAQGNARMGNDGKAQQMSFDTADAANNFRTYLNVHGPRFKDAIASGWLKGKLSDPGIDYAKTRAEAFDALRELKARIAGFDAVLGNHKDEREADKLMKKAEDLFQAWDLHVNRFRDSGLHPNLSNFGDGTIGSFFEGSLQREAQRLLVLARNLEREANELTARSLPVAVPAAVVPSPTTARSASQTPSTTAPAVAAAKAGVPTGTPAPAMRAPAPVASAYRPNVVNPQSTDPLIRRVHDLNEGFFQSLAKRLIYEAALYGEAPTDKTVDIQAYLARAEPSFQLAVQGNELGVEPAELNFLRQRAAAFDSLRKLKDEIMYLATHRGVGTDQKAFRILREMEVLYGDWTMHVDAFVLIVQKYQQGHEANKGNSGNADAKFLQSLTDLTAEANRLKDTAERLRNERLSLSAEILSPTAPKKEEAPRQPVVKKIAFGIPAKLRSLVSGGETPAAAKGKDNKKPEEPEDMTNELDPTPAPQRRETPDHIIALTPELLKEFEIKDDVGNATSGPIVIPRPSARRSPQTRRAEIELGDADVESAQPYTRQVSGGRSPAPLSTPVNSSRVPSNAAELVDKSTQLEEAVKKLVSTHLSTPGGSMEAKAAVDVLLSELQIALRNNKVTLSKSELEALRTKVVYFQVSIGYLRENGFDTRTFDVRVNQLVLHVESALAGAAPATRR